jgi:hypothetical protein
MLIVLSHEAREQTPIYLNPIKQASVSSCYRLLRILKTFEVGFLFTCPVSLRYNNGMMNYEAEDVVDARERAKMSARCSNCDERVPIGHHFSITIKEVKIENIDPLIATDTYPRTQNVKESLVLTGCGRI